MQNVDELLNVTQQHGSETGEDFERIAEGWNKKKQSFYEQSGIKETVLTKPADDFAQELDELLCED